MKTRWVWNILGASQRKKSFPWRLVGQIIFTKMVTALFPIPHYTSSLGLSYKVPSTGWLTQQKCIVSHFWKLHFQDSSVDKVASFWRLWGKICPCFPSSFWWFGGSFQYSLSYRTSPWSLSNSPPPHFFKSGCQSYWIGAHPNDLIHGSPW